MMDTQMMGALGHMINGSLYVFYVFLMGVIMHWANFFLGVILYFMIYSISNYVQRSLMHVKVLDNVLKSPIYSEFSSAIVGLIPIRCYNQGGNFLKKFIKIVNKQTISEMSFVTIQRIQSVYPSFFANIIGLSATGILIFFGK
jgi:hypothetical protein